MVSFSFFLLPFLASLPAPFKIALIMLGGFSFRTSNQINDTAQAELIWCPHLETAGAVLGAPHAITRGLNHSADSSVLCFACADGEHLIKEIGQVLCVKDLLWSYLSLQVYGEMLNLCLRKFIMSVLIAGSQHWISHLC